MSAEAVTFYILAAVTLGSAAVVVLSKSLINSAFSLLFSFFGVAGFYVLLEGEHDVEGFAPVLEATLTDLLTATEVPAANEVQCGWGAHHTLEGAQAAARTFLDRRAEWAQVSAS